MQINGNDTGDSSLFLYLLLHYDFVVKYFQLRKIVCV